jgi:phosphatidylglycerol:prolipoprotein diacylglycerol transferase
VRPVLFRLGGLEIPTHDIFLVLGVLVALALFALELRRRGLGGDPRIWQIAAGAMIGGAIFARVSVSWRYLARTPDPSLAGLWLYGGKTVLGGLAGAYLGALLAKRTVGIRWSTGDLFAPAVCLGLAVGRIGCFLTEQIGTTTSMPWGIRVDPEVAERIPNCPQCALGVPMHPSFLYEIAFLLGLFAVLRWLGPRIRVQGDLFKIFLLAYGVFRFFVEYVRGNETFALGLSGSQVFLLGTLPLLVAYFARRAVRRAPRPAPREVMTT